MGKTKEFKTKTTLEFEVIDARRVRVTNTKDKTEVVIKVDTRIGNELDYLIKRLYECLEGQDVKTFSGRVNHNLFNMTIYGDYVIPFLRGFRSINPKGFYTNFPKRRINTTVLNVKQLTGGKLIITQSNNGEFVRVINDTKESNTDFIASYLENCAEVKSYSLIVDNCGIAKKGFMYNVDTYGKSFVDLLKGFRK